MKEKPNPLTPEELRLFAEDSRYRDTLVAYADAWDGERAELRAARSKQISCFVGEHPPTFRQGEPVHELEELTTAEDCTAFVRIITELRADVRALLEELDPGFCYTEPRDAPKHAVFRYTLVSLELLNKVRKRVDLPELK